MPAATKKNTKPRKKVAKKVTKKTTKKKRAIRDTLKKKPELPSVDVSLLDFPEGEDEMEDNQRAPAQVRTIRYCRRCLGILKDHQKTFCSEECQKFYQGNFNIFFKKPSGYKREYTDKVLKEYLVWVEEMNQSVYIESARGVLHSQLKQMHVPSVTSYGCYIGISRQTMANWRDQFPEMDEAMQMLLAYQEWWITNKVSEGLMERGTANLLLGHNHNIIPKKEIEGKHIHIMGFVDDVYKQVEAMENKQLPAPKNE